LGAYSFASSGPIDLGLRGLSQAGTWNYLREEITVALECRRPVRNSIDFQFHLKPDMDDDMRANAISHLLARIINFCFGESAEQEALVDTEKMWQGLRNEVRNWRNSLPPTFKPFSTALKAGNMFPSIWLVRPCHGIFFPSCKILAIMSHNSTVAGEQYCHIAELLLELSQPVLSLEKFGLKGREANHHTIQTAALVVCGLAFTNDNIAARVNAFGPLSFCKFYTLVS